MDPAKCKLISKNGPERALCINILIGSGHCYPEAQPKSYPRPVQEGNRGVFEKRLKHVMRLYRKGREDFAN